MASRWAAEVRHVQSEEWGGRSDLASGRITPREFWREMNQQYLQRNQAAGRLSSSRL
jgi:hypothetical protein